MVGGVLPHVVVHVSVFMCACMCSTVQCTVYVRPRSVPITRTCVTVLTLLCVPVCTTRSVYRPMHMYMVVTIMVCSHDHDHGGHHHHHVDSLHE